MPDSVASSETNDADPPIQKAARKRKNQWPGRLGRFEPTSAREAVRTEILELIRSGELKPGARLPSEPQLIEMTGVSRSTVRESLRSLESMGLIEVRRGNGTFVRAFDPDNAIDTQILLMLGDRKALEDLIEMRLAIEPLIVKLAAERATEEDLATIALALDGMANAGDIEEWRPYHLYFHQALATAARNTMMSMIWSTITVFLKDSPLVKHRPVSPSAVHETIYEAIVARDPQRAIAAMAVHQQEMVQILQDGTLDH